jgi:hypothetical protein
VTGSAADGGGTAAPPCGAVAASSNEGWTRIIARMPFLDADRRNRRNGDASADSTHTTAYSLSSSPPPGERPVGPGVDALPRVRWISSTVADPDSADGSPRGGRPERHGRPTECRPWGGPPHTSGCPSRPKGSSRGRRDLFHCSLPCSLAPDSPMAAPLAVASSRYFAVGLTRIELVTSSLSGYGSNGRLRRGVSGTEICPPAARERLLTECPTERSSPR